MRLSRPVLASTIIGSSSSSSTASSSAASSASISTTTRAASSTTASSSSTTTSTTSTAKYLTPGNPTGLTGLFTHASPRSALIALYTQTLARANALPPHSAYRTAVEALTRHRLGIVESVRPVGWDAWALRARKVVEENPLAFAGDAAAGGAGIDTAGAAGSAGIGTTGAGAAGGTLDTAGTASNGDGYGGGGDDNAASLGSGLRIIESAGRRFVVRREKRGTDGLLQEQKEDEDVAEGEGVGTEADKRALIQRLEANGLGSGRGEELDWIEEPPLSVDQIEDIENRIGAGLIEEVIQVAEGELKLVGVMAETKVWEQLEEKAPEGQWTYFERGTHMPKTVAPPI